MILWILLDRLLLQAPNRPEVPIWKTRPYRLAALTTARPSAMVRVMGFSHQMSFPASAQAMVDSLCSASRVAIETAVKIDDCSPWGQMPQPPGINEEPDSDAAKGQGQQPSGLPHGHGLEVGDLVRYRGIAVGTELSDGYAWAANTGGDLLLPPRRVPLAHHLGERR